MTVTAPRRRSRRVATPQATPEDQVTLDAELEALFVLKVKQDEATAAYKAASAEFKQRMEKSGKIEHTIDARGNRPAVKATIASKTLTSIDPAKFQKKVSAAEFLTCVSVTVKEAKKLLGDNDLAEVSKTTKSAASLSVRALGGSRS